MLAKIARLDGSDRVSRTRRRIHDAAQRTFSEKGLAAQIDDIVHAAGVSRGTFYNYYRTSMNCSERSPLNWRKIWGIGSMLKGSVLPTRPSASPMASATFATMLTPIATGDIF